MVIEAKKKCGNFLFGKRDVISGGTGEALILEQASP
jgi:hypothetical protein